MVNSSPVTSLSFLESRLILVTKNRNIAPTAKQRQLVINCKSYDEEYEATLRGDLDFLQTNTLFIIVLEYTKQQQ